MISVVTEHGSSFKGLTAYLMHDIGSRDSSERVAWTHTHNLATDDPDTAWRVMASTTSSQAELKAEAGVANTGRKSQKSVMHYILSWHADEQGEYSRDEMVDAALASLTYLGVDEGERIGKKVTAKRSQRGIEHQAMIVCHDEGPGSRPHVHVMVNRVHPQHGVMLPDSKDYEKLSAWALDYRRSQGKEDMCPERVKNAAKKAQGVLTSHPRKPRNIYEQELEIADAEPGSRKKALLEQQARRAKELKAATTAMRQRHREQIRGLEDRLVGAERNERAWATETATARRSEIRASYAPQIADLVDKQRRERDAFFDGHRTAAGRVRNTWEAFKTKEWMREIRTRPVHALRHGFTLAFDSGMQLRDIEAFHKREMGELRGRRRGEERRAANEIRAVAQAKLEDLRDTYMRDRGDALLEQAMDKAKLKAEWRQLTQDRRAALAEGGRSPDRQASQAPEVVQDGSQKTDQGGGDGGSCGSIAAQQSEQASTGIDHDPPDDARARRFEELRRLNHDRDGPEQD